MVNFRVLKLLLGKLTASIGPWGRTWIFWWNVEVQLSDERSS